MAYKRIGCLGGSFDPIHKGHLELAKQILKDGCDEVWFIPSLSTPLKDRKLTAYEDRYRMIKLAIAPYRRMRVCAIEKTLPVPSYTLQTLQALKKRYPDASFNFYLGGDQAKQLDRWYKIEECFHLAQFKVFLRDQEELSCPYDLPIVKMPLIDMSSTKVREGRLQDCPASVRRYIAEQGLYLSDYVASQLNEKRYLHSLSVAQLSVELAKAHGLDEIKAYRIGMLHDVCKYWNYEKGQRFMKAWFPDKLKESAAIWHGYLAAKEIKRFYKIKDKQIIQAVYHHVKGSSLTPYTMIIYLADKLDPSRGYDSSMQIDLAKKDLKKAYLLVQKEQEEYLKKEKK